MLLSLSYNNDNNIKGSFLYAGQKKKKSLTSIFLASTTSICPEPRWLKLIY